MSAAALGLIAAIARNGVIGWRGGLPWRLPDDLRHFKRTTLGHCLILGRATWESLPGALPGRTSIVVSRRSDFAPQGAVAVDSFEAALAAARARGDAQPIVAGGAAIYALALPRATRMWLTRVDAEPEGDTWFPAWDEAAWQRVDREDHAADARHAHAFAIETWERKSGSG